MAEGVLMRVFFDDKGQPLVQPPEYVFQEFPKMMYSAGKEPVTVASQDEQDALGKGWSSKPV